MIFKRIICIVMILSVLMLSIGCEKMPESVSSGVVAEKTEKQELRDYITILYSAGDSFNPYTAKTNINRQMMTLLYEPLVSVDNEFKAVYRLAESVTLKGKKCTVKIKDAVFSDGSQVTADDVVYSCKLALKSKNSYKTKLYEVKSVNAAGRRTVEFALSKQDPYFENVLDFPIIKTGSDKITDSDSVAQPPIGSGRYIVSDDRKGLEANPRYNGKMGSIKKIRLINAPDSESVSHYAQIGAPDMYYSDISDGNILRISGTKLDVNLNNLVYIGINQNKGALKYNALRQAISTGLDRAKICKDYYYNNAVAATGFFNPAWSAVSSVQNIQINANSKITVENLEEIGYNRLDSKGLRRSKSGSYLSFTMLVNSENRIRVSAAKGIAEQLLSYGIKITVIEKKFAAYKNAIKSGEFELYLGEVKLTDNMDISCLAAKNGKLAYGQKKNTSKNNTEKTEKSKVLTTGTHKVLDGFYSGKNSITDLAVVLQTEMPFIPVLYRTGVLFCNDKIENINQYSKSDIYFSVDSYKIYQ